MRARHIRGYRYVPNLANACIYDICISIFSQIWVNAFIYLSRYILQTKIYVCESVTDDMFFPLRIF